LPSENAIVSPYISDPADEQQVNLFAFLRALSVHGFVRLRTITVTIGAFFPSVTVTVTTM